MTVIKAEHLSKYYRLGLINNGTLAKDLQTWFAKLKGKVDPHSVIGSEHYFDATQDGFWALKDLEFEIKEGDRVGIIGKNGAGKSTLLKILSRITAPTEGLVKIRGRVASLLEVGTGFNGELTGRENIYLNGAILGMKRREVTQKLDEIIAFSEIGAHIDTPVKRYSSGMYVRLAFAVAAHLDSEILIADEVLAVGDASFQNKAIGKMNQLSKGEGRTVLFVSHSMNSIKNLCNAGIILEQGRVIKQTHNIDEAIDCYLGIEDSENITAIKTWENSETFFSPHFNPLRLEALDSKGKLQSKALDYDKTYRVRLTFEIKDLDKMMSFFIGIYLQDERIAKIVPESDYTSKINVGLNTFDMIIPSKLLLPDNVYTFSVGAEIKNSKEIIPSQDFEVSIIIPVINTKSQITMLTSI